MRVGAATLAALHGAVLTSALVMRSQAKAPLQALPAHAYKPFQVKTLEQAKQELEQSKAASSYSVANLMAIKPLQGDASSVVEQTADKTGLENTLSDQGDDGRPSGTMETSLIAAPAAAPQAHPDADTESTGAKSNHVESVTAAPASVPEADTDTVPGTAKSAPGSEGPSLTATEAGPGNKFGTCPRIETRVEWRSYPHEDRIRFLDAIVCLMEKPSEANFRGAKSRYEDLVVIHQDYVDNVHHNAKFTQFHRLYLYTFHDLLRRECGFDGVPPWWDFTLDAGNFANSPLFRPEYFGSLPPGPTPTCVTDGKFAGRASNVGPGGSNTTPHCIARAGNETSSADAREYYVDICAQRNDFAQWSQCVEDGPHAMTHNGIGADMSDVASSPGDASFFMLHSGVDRLFAKYVNSDPTGRRKTTVTGNGANDIPLTYDTPANVRGLVADVTVGQMMDTENFPLCYRYSY